MSRRFVATGLVAGAAVCTLIVACSSSSTPVASPSPDASASGSASTTPPGTTATTDAGIVGCSPLQPGCFTASGSYAMPATPSCASAGGPTAGAADSHCEGVPVQSVSGASCSVSDAGAPASDDAGATADDAGAAPTPGPCGENGGDYGQTMYGSSGKDDDCKYQVSYTASPICENNGTYFVVQATYLAGTGAPVVGACTQAELCLSDTHPAPVVDSRPPQGAQQVVEGPPGTYTIGPVVFDAPGDWTVRFHFNELCCDIADDSPHGHAAFHVSVP
jgi:hypothetical protein